MKLRESDKSVVEVYLLFLFLLIFRSLEYCFVYSSTTHMIITCFFGFAIVFACCKFKNLKLKDIGLHFKFQKISNGFLISLAVFACGMVALLAFNLIESAFYHVGLDKAKDLYFYSEENSVFINGIKNFLKYIGWGMFLCLVQSVFLETFFRGYMFQTLSQSQVSFAYESFLQAYLFAIWFAVTPVFNLFVTDNIKQGLVYLAFYLSYNILLAVKHNLLRRITKSLWAPIFSYFFMDFFIFFVHFNDEASLTNIDFARKIFIQLIMLIVTYMIYINNRKKVKKADFIKKLKASDKIIRDIPVDNLSIRTVAKHHEIDEREDKDN